VIDTTLNAFLKRKKTRPKKNTAPFQDNQEYMPRFDKHEIFLHPSKLNENIIEYNTKVPYKGIL